MAINDFVRRSIQIVGGGIAQSTTDYFDNAISFTNDVKEVIDMGKQMGSDGAKKFNELKSSGILKKTRDWFYNEGGMFGDFDFDDDDFDAGFEIDSADSEKDNESSKPLSKDVMTDIAKKQTGAMYKAFGRQADLHIANTAEIISTINTRTAELTASVNNVNNTLIQIGKRLDLIVEWTSARTKKEEEEKRTAGILDYGGGISLTGVVNKAKENAEDSMLGTFMSIGKTMLGSGMMTPETVMSMILSQTILEKKWDKLGGKSINDIGEFINDTVGEVIQNTMTKVLTSKNEILESLFEDIITKSGRKNYQNSVKNTYNDKPAVFDGMTRKSIISVIPGYLNEILKAVSKDGVGREVDSKGNLTKTKTNSFVKEVADSYFRPGTMEWSRRKAAAERTNLTEHEVGHAVRTLTGCWVWYMYRSGRVILEVGEVKNILAESTRSVVDNAAYMMSTADPKHRSEDEWKSLYQGIIEQIDEFKYRQELQRSAERADKNLETFAKSHVNNHQAKTVDKSVIMQAFRHNYSDFNEDAKFRNPSEPGSTGASPTAIGSGTNLLGITELDYMAGIFDRLNKGLNVFVTGQSNNKKKKYNKINMVPGYAARKIRGGGTSAADDSEEGGIAPVVDKLKDALSNSDKKKEKMDDATKEAYEAKERGEELSKEQEKLLKEYEKNNGLFGALKKIPGKIKSGISHFAGESRKEYFMDPTVREFSESMSDIFSDIKKKVSDITPDFIKEKFNEVKESKVGQTVSEGVNTGKNKAKDFMLGHEETNEEGEHVRTGGVLHAVAKPLSSAGTFIGNTSAKFMTTKHLNNKVNDIFDKFKEGGSHAPGGENFNAGSNDYMHIQILSSMADAAMSNGEVSTEDKQTMYKEIAAIDDKDIQKRLRQYLVPLMERNSKSKDKTGTGAGTGEPSTLGKLGKLLFGGIKLAIGPIVTYVKLIIGSVFFIIKKGMGTILKFAMKGIRSGLTDIKSGFKSVVSGVKKMFKPVGKLVKGAINVAYKVGKKMSEIGSSIIKGVKKGFTTVFSGIGKLFGKDKNKPQKDPSQQSGVKKFLSGIGDKFAKSSFGQGFMKARNERKEAQAKAKLKEQAAPVVEGIDTSEAGKDLKEVLESEDGKKGVFKKLITLVQGIFDKVPDQKQEEGNNPETSENENNQQTEENNTTENTQTEQQSTTPTPAASEGGESSGGGGGGGLKGFVGKVKDGAKGVLGGIGEALGGLTNIMGGVLKVVLSIVMSLEGFKALTKLVTTILTESLQPLNKAFQAITKALKPVFKQLGGIIKQLSEFIVVIVDAVVDVIKPILTDVIQPILEVLSPLLEAILGAITPILKIVGILLKVIMAPLMGLFKFVLLPILKIIGDAVQIIMGVLQIGFGLIMICLGGIIGAIGKVISCIPGAGGKGKELAKSGGDMLDQGKDFVAQGMKSVVQGIVNIVLDYASLYSLGASDALLGRGEEEDKKETKKIEAPENSNSVQNTYANGDVNNYFGSSDIYNTYGGEYQRGMGGYLNMDQRGCGPIALADMYNRNQSGRVSARSLAGSMFNNGTYDPRRGTSVGGYIDSARSLGMNLTPGKVTQQSLKSASPTHPITVVGSGSDYGTRNGNNHFMNVIGTDSHGTAFVSNPLTGRIDRRPASTVAGSAVMGLYGSGDEADGGYTFPDAIKNAFQKLKDEAAKILGLFNMEKSDEEETEELIGAEQKKAAAEQAKKELGEDYAQYEEKAKAAALEDFKKKYPQKDSESDEDYQAAFDKWWEGDADQAKYLAEAGVLDSALEAAKKKNSTVWNELKEGTDNFQKKMLSSLESIKKSNNEGHDGGGGGAGTVSASASGAVMDSFGVPKYADLDMNDFIDPSTNKSGHSLVHSYFGAKNDDTAWSYDGNYYTRRYHPNSEGEGSSGSPDHHGIDINFDKGSEGTPLYAITGGKVVSSQGGGLVETPSSNGGCGNNVQWKDSGGYYHWYMHMRDDPLVNAGEEIEPGQLIGYVGDTGWSSGAHLHYSVNKAPGSSGNQPVNPLLYWDTFEPGGDLVGDTDEEKIWAYLTSHGFEKHAAAGAMGAFEVESDNNPNTLEGFYAFDDRTRNNAVVREALQNYDTLDDYVVNKLFPYYDSIGKSIIKSDYKGIDGHYYPGLGLAQWTADRTKALSEYTVQKGLGWNNLAGQLDYLKHELDSNSYYSGAVTEMNNSNDVNKSTEIWVDKFEGVPGNALAERQKYANDFYNRFQNWTPLTKKTFSPTGKGSVSTGFGLVSSADDARRVDNYNQIKSSDGKNTGVVFTESGNLMLREGMGTDTPVLIEIPKGTSLNLEASGNSAWFKTTFGGKTGYVSSAYILLDNDEANSFDYSDGLTTKTVSDDESEKYLNAYKKTARLGSPNVNTNEVAKDFQNYLMNNEGMSWSDIVNAGNKLYTGTWKAGDPSKLWLWARDNYNKQSSNNKKSSSIFSYSEPIGPKLFDSGILTAPGSNNDNSTTTTITTNGGSGMYNMNNATTTTTTTTVANYSGGSHSGSSHTRGSGDADAILAEDKFWNTYLGWNNSSPNVTPGLSDGSDTAYSTDTYYDTETGATVVNNYAVTRAEDKATDARLKAILANTYNIRSESMEALLEAILEELRKRRDPKGGGNNTNGSQKLFDERIPSQVTKLSIG